MPRVVTRRRPRSVAVALAVGLAILLTILAPAPVNAEDATDADSGQQDAASRRQLSLGLKGGVTLADGRGNIEGSGTDIVGVRPGFSVGAVAIYLPSARLGLQGELLFVRRVTGSSAPGGGFGAEADYKIRGTFVQLPLLLRYQLPAGFGNIVPALLVGPSLSYPISVRRELVVSGRTQTLEFEPGDLDVGVLAGIAFDVPIAGRTLTLDARYTLGMRDLDTGAIPGGELKFGSFAALAGVMF